MVWLVFDKDPFVTIEERGIKMTIGWDTVGLRCARARVGLDYDAGPLDRDRCPFGCAIRIRSVTIGPRLLMIGVWWGMVGRRCAPKRVGLDYDTELFGSGPEPGRLTSRTRSVTIGPHLLMIGIRWGTVSCRCATTRVGLYYGVTPLKHVRCLEGSRYASLRPKSGPRRITIGIRGGRKVVDVPRQRSGWIATQAR